jgi:hypothetical protein
MAPLIFLIIHTSFINEGGSDAMQRKVAGLQQQRMANGEEIRRLHREMERVGLSTSGHLHTR